MYLIKNKEKEVVAYIQNMMILDASHKHVVGILIGDCFFGKNNKVIGKIIKQTAYLLSGEIVGKIEVNNEKEDFNIKKKLMLEAWDILMNIKEHTADWITESSKWSKVDFIKHLK